MFYSYKNLIQCDAKVIYENMSTDILQQQKTYLLVDCKSLKQFYLNLIFVLLHSKVCHRFSFDSGSIFLAYQNERRKATLQEET